MSDSKKCPLNGFDPCIGKECVFFLEPMHTKGFIDLDNMKGDLIVDPGDISFPCSITVMGKVAFLSHKPKPKRMEK